MRKATGNNAVLETKSSFRATMKKMLDLFLHGDSSTAINEGLGCIKQFFGADRVFVGYFDEREKHLLFLYESCSENVDSLGEYLEEDFRATVFVENSKYHWWIDNLRAGRNTVIDNVHEVSEECKELVSCMIENNVKSVISSPVYGDKRITGFLGIEFVTDFHAWTEAEIEIVNLFSELFSIVIEKELTHRKAESSRKDALRGNTLFQKVFYTLPIGIEVYDERGYLVDINPFDLAQLGTTREKILGINLYDNPIISTEDKESIRAGKDTIVSNDYSYDTIREAGYYETKFEGKTIRLNGRYLPLKDELGNIFGLLALVHHDESYYLQKEELQANLAKLKLAVNSNNSFLWDYDIEQDKVTVDFEFLGKNKERWGKLLLDPAKNRQEHFAHFHEKDRERVRKGVEALIKGESSFFTARYSQYMGDGNLYHFSSNYSVYKRDETGKPLSLICLTTDVTELYEQEMELFKAKEALEVKNTFIENISHEIRTPLNIIVGFSNVLAESSNNVENQYIIDLIHDNNRQLLELVDNILSFSQITQGRMEYKLELVDVEQLCRGAFKLKYPGKKDGNEFIFDDSHLSCMVEVDKDRLLQVIYLLLDNANRYTDDGMVRLSYYQDTPETVRIEVKDTGMGLTDNEINDLTLQFYKVNSFNKGLGLGLPLSRKIVEDMGGSCYVESKKGEGSCFWFTLPLVK